MAGFFGAFLGGFAARATQIRDKREEDRQRLIREAIADLRDVVKRREERIDEARRRREQAGALAAISGHGMPASTIEGLLPVPGMAEAIMSGRVRASGGINPAAAASQTPDALGVAPNPASPSGTGVSGAGQAVAPSAPGLGAPAPTDPRDMAQAMPQTATDQISTPESGRGFFQRAGDVLFGREPTVGIAEEARRTLARNRGMTDAELQAVLAGPPSPPVPPPGSVRVNPFTPEQLARLGVNFRDAEGYRRFIESGGEDTSGVLTYGDKVEAEMRIAAARAALRGSGGGQMWQPNSGDFNAALNAMASVGSIPIGNNRRATLIPRTDSQGRVIGVTVNLPSSDPAYADVQRKLAHATARLGDFLGMYRGNHGAAAVAALVDAGLLSREYLPTNAGPVMQPRNQTPTAPNLPVSGRTEENSTPPPPPADREEGRSERENDNRRRGPEQPRNRNRGSIRPAPIALTPDAVDRHTRTIIEMRRRGQDATGYFRSLPKEMQEAVQEHIRNLR